MTLKFFTQVASNSVTSKEEEGTFLGCWEGLTIWLYHWFNNACDWICPCSRSPIGLSAFITIGGVNLESIWILLIGSQPIFSTRFCFVSICVIMLQKCESSCLGFGELCNSWKYAIWHLAWWHEDLGQGLKMLWQGLGGATQVARRPLLGCCHISLPESNPIAVDFPAKVCLDPLLSLVSRKHFNRSVQCFWTRACMTGWRDFACWTSSIPKWLSCNSRRLFAFSIWLFLVRFICLMEVSSTIVAI